MSERLAYAAGLIDGEGYIGLTRHGENRRNGAETTYYTPRLTVTMCDLEGVELLSEEFGGKISWKGPQGNHKGKYEWRVTGMKRLSPILESLVPFLRVKKAQAMLVLSFIQMRNDVNVGKLKPGETSYTGSEHEAYLACKKLNQRGCYVSVS